ncbi:MAG: DUF47 family protein [Candidatus Lokiarchaeota archaeon]|nr:DUF47 family protein [Candidatus Lokiarchaeota archaeon]MBD3340424.1 DUF47 family protein [Candidatus Lokiarchaeota archaeon]
MGSLIEYFKKKTTLNVLERAITHAKTVQETVRELKKGIESLLTEQNFEKAIEMFRNVDKIEGKADRMRRKIQHEISKGELNPSVRTDLAHLVKYIDQIANCACGVSRRIATIPETFWKQSSKETIELILEMMNKTTECVEFLDKIVIDLIEERVNIKNYAREINRLEHEVDLINIKLRRSLQETKYDVHSFTIFTLGNTMDIMEAISDSIETVADYIVQLLYSSRAL